MKSLSRYLAVACVSFAAVIAAPASAKDDILVIGDSMLEWQSFKGASIPHFLAKDSGRRVENRSASGAKLYLTGAEGNPRSVISAQYSKGNWNWVVVNGGANDLLVKCGCRRCDKVLNKLISADAKSGILPDLVKKIRSDGPRVIVLAYYKGNERPNLFTKCVNEVTELARRQRLLAKRVRGVEFVGSKAAIDPSNRSHFALDGIHLSRKGTRRVGTFLARSLKSFEQARR